MPTVTIPSPPTAPANGGYQMPSEADIEARANAYADAAIADQQAQIERQRQAATAAAQRDAATYAALGQAQMGMISQIPANIQAIRDTAAQAMASTAGQITSAQLQQQQGELAQNAAFSASQVGNTARAAPTPGGVNPVGAAAAEEAMGGTFPAQQQVGMGAASAAAAAGMPAVVARATQDQVAMRMAQAATQDADYRQQLIDAAAKRGGIYQDALSSLWDLETKKYGIYESQQKMALDQQNYQLQLRAQRANEALARGKAAFDQWYKQQKLGISEGQLKLATTKAANALQLAISKGARPDAALSKVYGYVVDSNGRAITDANGGNIPVARPPSTQKPPKGGVAKANSMALQFRGTPFSVTTDPKTKQKVTIRNMPKVTWASAFHQISAAMVDEGYSQNQADTIAKRAVNTAYGPGIGGRPKDVRLENKALGLG